jgi:hypothetical protein
MQKRLPRFVIAKTLVSGDISFYFNIPTHYRRLGCTIPNEPLGNDYAVACGTDGNGGRAKALNGLFDEWNNHRKGQPLNRGPLLRFGTVDWVFREYKSSKAYLEKVAARSRPDYERTMLLVADLITNKGDRLGGRGLLSITPRAADKIYDRIIQGKTGLRLRQGEKAIALCAKAWDVVRRLYPNEFDRKVPNPWDGVTIKTRTKKKKAAVTREQVYQFAHGCIEQGKPEAAAAAVICFEWLQRPENVLAGYVRWTDYRSKEWPNAIRIEHHKTGELVWHPLEETVDGVRTAFYADAEAVLAKVPRRGTPMILREIAPSRRHPDRPTVTKPYAFSGMQKLVQTMRAKLGLPATFTLDACRHGGMTELEEAALTDGQGRALSAHRSQQSYEGYAKRTLERALPATRKRHAHRLANEQRTKFQNEGSGGFQNEPKLLDAAEG